MKHLKRGLRLEKIGNTIYKIYQILEELDY